MKKFLIKYLFADYEQELLQKEKNLILFERKLNQLELEINRQEEINDLNALSLVYEKNVLNKKERSLEQLKIDIEDKKKAHANFVILSKDSIAKKRKELSKYEKELNQNKILLDAYLQEIEEKKVENENIRIRNEEVANYKIVNVRGKEALIDKYGNFKQFT